MILAIDPGNIQSAWVVMDEAYKPIKFGITENNELLQRFRDGDMLYTDKVVIEMIASYGMPVGATVFDTCVWIGRFHEANENNTFDKAYYHDVSYVYRKDVKSNLCRSAKAKDANVRQALIDRFGVVGTKKAQGWFYGFRADIWAAYAVGVTYLDSKIELPFTDIGFL